MASCALTQSPRQEKRPDTDSKTDGSTPPIPTPAAPEIRVAAQQTKPPNTQPANGNQRIQQRVWEIEWSNWALLIAAIWAGKLALRTLKTQTTQIRINRSALGSSRNAAKAAKESADAARLTMLIAHRPRLLVWPITIDGIEDNGRLLPKLTNGKVTLTNVGALNAVLFRFHAQWLHGPRLPPRNPARDVLDEETVAGIVKPGYFTVRDLPDFDVPQELYRSIGLVAKTPNANSMSGARERLFLIGYIKYQDEIGLLRQYFAFEYDPSTCQFERVEHPAYNYDG